MRNKLPLLLIACTLLSAIVPFQPRAFTQGRNIGVGPSQPGAGGYHALVIGNNNYASLPKLKTAEADAKKAGAPAPKPAVPVPAVDPSAFELEYWNAIKNSTDPEEYRDYLKRYPNGRFADIARRRAATRSVTADTGAGGSVTGTSPPPVLSESGAKDSAGGCSLSLSTDSLRMEVGASATVRVGVIEHGVSASPEAVSAATPNWDQLVVLAEVPRAGERQNFYFTVTSIGERPGTYPVKFNSGCGSRTLEVKVVRKLVRG